MKHLKILFLLTALSPLLPAYLFAQQGSMDWTLKTDTAAWTARREHASVVFDDRIWVLGGNASDDSRKNDVWYSSDGANWTCATESAGWSRRRNHAAVVFDNKMWVLGGYNRTNDVWYSSDGVNWTRACSSAGWSRRDGHTAVVFNNKIWVLGGYATSTGRMNDVWYSSDGVNWLLATDTAGWSKRDNHVAVVFDNKIWVIGGYATAGGRQNDVWYSTDGVNWTQATDSAGWSARAQHTAIVFDNKMWVLGGNGSRMNDVWYSSDGVNWTQATNSAGWTRRVDHTANTFDNKIWVLGGYDGHRKNDVWFSKGYIATLISPNGGDTLYGGNTQIIQWHTNLTTFTQFRLLFSIDGGLTYPDTIANNLVPSETTYQWIVPFINARQCRVMVQVVNNDSIRVQDASDNNFAIQTVYIISPNGGEIYAGGTNQIIQWRTYYPDFLFYRLLLIRPYNEPDTIADNLTLVDTLYNWIVPLINSEYCQVKIQMKDSSGNVVLEDSSDNEFTIQTIAVISPNGNEFWAGNSNKIIKWRTFTPISFSHYRLLLSTDGGQTFPNTIANNVSSTESTYIWSVLNVNSDMCIIKVQIMNTADSILSEDESDEYFTIDSDPPSQFSLLLPLNNGWTGRNLTFTWQPAIDNFAMSYYQLAIAIPSETLSVNAYDTTYTSIEGGNWTQATSSAGWSARDGHTSVVFDNKIWVMGGDDEDEPRNDVWYSVDGVNWTQTTASAGWEPRANHTSVVFDNKIWVLGGYDYNYDYLNDVWYSSDGVNWTQACSSSFWSPRDGHTSVVFDNKIWVMGGYDYNDVRNDVWYSTDGANWIQATASAEWDPRDGHTSFVFDNKMWVVGGNDVYRKNDAWYSTDGVNWTCATPSADWLPRAGHTSVVFDNKMWVIGGDWSSDVWYSLNGINWVCATPSPGWSPREHHTSVVYDNKIWVIGGDMLNDVWYSSLQLHLPEGTQSWWVTAFDRAGNSRHSNETFIVRIDTTLPTIPSLISPNDSALISDSFVPFIWNHTLDIPSGIFGYRIQISNSPYFEPCLDTIIQDTSITVQLNDSTYWWHVCAIDSGGNKSSWSIIRTFKVQTTGIEEITSLPLAMTLGIKIYPNPAKSQTTIHYTLPSKCQVTLLLYDVTGRLVKSLVNEEKRPGIYKITLNTKQLSTGVYFISLKTESPKRIMKRLVIVK